MKKLKDGMKVRIKSNKSDWNKHERPWYTEQYPCTYNDVVIAYNNQSIMITAGSYMDKRGIWVCDLRNPDGTLIGAGFESWELRRVFFYR